ncbi:DNA alkylation repair protein [Phreatobacter stygius]|uniref:DNA alkylation repair protein n=1 Tax=Phreatobacter stygius TaxID=1940610 RepID=A0A4D7BMU6_9HYPH|nr:DNA alkylation repair protein [Phreatobacter stygius]QCI68972.1 DNA alkylation repair protein [Phreatobacter stygius]
MTTESAPALKEIFNRQRLQHLATETAGIDPSFDAKAFLRLASANLDDLSIMQRLRQIAETFHQVLAGPFEANLRVLHALAPRINHGFASIVLPEYVALYGADHFDASMTALHYFTRFGSSEFAIRHFLQRDLKRTLAVMERWSQDDNEHVRRLASEGCRPRLPWSFQLKPLMADPRPVAAILDNLKADDSLYVRKSVANHLNDITKDNPDWVLATIAGWPRDNARTTWIAKQALRTLIKRGDQRALDLVGAARGAAVRVEAFAVTPARLSLGERLTLSARLVSTAAEPQKLIVDYAVHYVKKSGAASAKVFKLREILLEPSGECTLSISQVIRDFTTRKHHAGHHRLELLVNGQSLAEGGFTLEP